MAGSSPFCSRAQHVLSGLSAADAQRLQAAVRGSRKSHEGQLQHVDCGILVSACASLFHAAHDAVTSTRGVSMQHPAAIPPAAFLKPWQIGGRSLWSSRARTPSESIENEILKPKAFHSRFVTGRSKTASISRLPIWSTAIRRGLQSPQENRHGLQDSYKELRQRKEGRSPLHVWNPALPLFAPLCSEISVGGDWTTRWTGRSFWSDHAATRTTILTSVSRQHENPNDRHADPNKATPAKSRPPRR